MDYRDNISLINSANLTYRLMINHIVNTLETLETSIRITTVEHKSIYSAKLTAANLHRIYNTMLYLLNPNSSTALQKVESYNIEAMMNEILSEFERMSETFAPLSVSFSSRLKHTDIITLSKTHFEFIILNLLYCCIKPVPNKQQKPIKIMVSASETTDYIVFHIYDNNKYFNPTEADDPMQSYNLNIDDISKVSAAKLLALSLCVAQKSAEDMNGKLTISSLKSSNRYDVYLPKTVDLEQYTMCSPTRYVPTYSYYNEILADIKLEYILTRVIESFEGALDGVRKL